MLCKVRPIARKFAAKAFIAVAAEQNILKMHENSAEKCEFP